MPTFLLSKIQLFVQLEKKCIYVYILFVVLSILLNSGLFRLSKCIHILVTCLKCILQHSIHILTTCLILFALPDITCPGKWILCIHASRWWCWNDILRDPRTVRLVFDKTCARNKWKGYIFIYIHMLYNAVFAALQKNCCTEVECLGTSCSAFFFSMSWGWRACRQHVGEAPDLSTC